MKKVLLAFVVMFSLAGCAEEQPVTNVCQSNAGGEVVFVSVGNEIQTMTEYDTYTFEDLSVTASFMAKEENQQELLDNYKALYATVTKGIDITMDVMESGVTFTITIDFMQADFNELKNLGILADADIEYVGLEETIAQMQLECTVQE